MMAVYDQVYRILRFSAPIKFKGHFKKMKEGKTYRPPYTKPRYVVEFRKHLLISSNVQAATKHNIGKSI